MNINMSKLSGFIDLLKAPFKILSKNGKLMAIIATIYVITYSLSYFLFTFFSNPFILDLTLKVFALISTQPYTPEYTQLLASIREDIGIFFGLESLFIVLYFFVFVFANTTVIVIASCTYTSNYLSLKELILKVSKTWTRPFVTSFYVHLLSIGYMSSLFIPFLVPTLVLYDHRALLITFLVLLAIIFFAFLLYLSVVWSLAIVVSVAEDTYGLSALGKARELVKGKRVDGFLLNLFLNLVFVVVFMVVYKLSPRLPIVAGVVQFICVGIVTLFQFMAYSGFYYQCKEQKAKLGGGSYSQVSSVEEV